MHTEEGFHNHLSTVIRGFYFWAFSDTSEASHRLTRRRLCRLRNEGCRSWHQYALNAREFNAKRKHRSPVKSHNNLQDARAEASCSGTAGFSFLLLRNTNDANIFAMCTRVNGHRASDMRKFLNVAHSKLVKIGGTLERKKHSRSYGQSYSLMTSKAPEDRLHSVLRTPAVKYG